MARRTYPTALARSTTFHPARRFDLATPEERMDRLLDAAEQRIVAVGTTACAPPRGSASALGKTRRMARRVFSSPHWESARVKRARMRERAANHLLERGFSLLTASGLTRATGGHLQALYIYPNLDALLADIVRLHQEKLADHITEVVLGASPLTGEGAHRGAGRRARGACGGDDDPRRHAGERRNFDCWLHGVLADAIGGEPDERAMLARSMLTLITDWSARLAASDAGSRAMCARVLTRMVSAERSL